MTDNFVPSTINNVIKCLGDVFENGNPDNLSWTLNCDKTGQFTLRISTPPKVEKKHGKRRRHSNKKGLKTKSPVNSASKTESTGSKTK